MHEIQDNKAKVCMAETSRKGEVMRKKIWWEDICDRKINANERHGRKKRKTKRIMMKKSF